jgi:D-alanine transaminase
MLREASASSVLVIIDGTMIAPPESPHILPGTSRRVVEELCDALGIPRRVADITEAQLRGAREIWLSAATREVQPVTRLDGQAVADGLPGPLWRRVYDAWQQLKT